MSKTRNELLLLIHKAYIPERIKYLDKDFVEFEEQLAPLEDLETIVFCLNTNTKLSNPHNSCILYATGTSNEFSFERARADTTGGSPPD